LSLSAGMSVEALVKTEAFAEVDSSGSLPLDVARGGELVEPHRSCKRNYQRISRPEAAAIGCALFDRFLHRLRGLHAIFQPVAHQAHNRAR